MAAGDRVSKAERTRIKRAVERAETATGLQLCVYLGPAEGDAREHAERLFHAAGANTRPAVMLYVAPDSRRVECVVAPQLVGRIPDAAAQQTIDAMIPVLATGDLAGGLAVGLQALAAAAGPPRGDEPDEQLPDILD